MLWENSKLFQPSADDSIDWIQLTGLSPEQPKCLGIIHTSRKIYQYIEGTIVSSYVTHLKYYIKIWSDKVNLTVRVKYEERGW